MMTVQIALAAVNGNWIATNSDHRVIANRDGVGAWETFRLFNRTRPDSDPQHGDSVVLQAWTGRFVTAVGGGGGIVNAEQRWIDTSSTFTIEKIEGTGTIRSDEYIALKAANGNYVVTENGGGGDVNANRPHRGAWETLGIKMFRPQLIRLRSSTNRFVTAEDGGVRDGAVTANRDRAGLWETFSLVNHSRSDRSIRHGDIVALQAWRGKFVRITSSGNIDVGANRSTQEALFRVSLPGGATIEHGQQIGFQSLRNSRYVAANAGVLVVDRTSATGDALFTIELAERAGIDFGWVPDGSEFPDRPVASPTYPVSGNRRLLILHVDDGVNPPVSASNEQVASAIVGPAPSLSDLYQAMSGGSFTMTRADAFGPIPILQSFTLGQILSAAESQGVPLASFARSGVISDSEVGLIRIGVGPGGQTGFFDEVSGGGVRYRGRSAGVGVTADVDEGSRAVIAHETSHMFLDQIDRYPLRRHLRGDVVANRTWVGDWEKFVVERIAGAGPIRSGDRVMIHAHNGQHLAVGSSPPDLVPDRINLEDGAAGDARVFTIAKVSGTGEITSGEHVTFRSNVGRFMTAELGGNSVVTANRTEARSWERFKIAKLGGAGAISSGDTVTLGSSGGFYLVAEEGTRDGPRDAATNARDLQRGYLWASGIGPGGNFDNASSNGRMVLLSLYDRIRLGWVRPRLLTPDNRGCYLIRPFLESREALILFDPQNPGEWYTLENRQRREDVDEVPSSGIVVSWICQDEGYWQWWFNRANDPEPGISITLWPAVISAVAPTVPPNMMALPVVFELESLTKRNDPNAAFTNQEVVLPLGNGDPSRFHLSFHSMAGENIAICIR
jgi:hypothetical protein